MNTEQMRAEFEQVFPALNKTAYNATLGYYLSTEEVSPYYEQTIREHNCRWQSWQACCKKQEDRIAESTRELTDLLGGALVALEQREDAPPYPLFSTKAEEILLAEIMEMKRKLADKREFESAVWRACDDLFITPEEAKAAIEAAGGRVKDRT